MIIEIQDISRLPKDFCIFFCWQDHLEPKLHRFLIRGALNAAIGRVQDELPPEANCVLRQDSDTMNRAGSVEISNAILDKINSSTVVIGDVTPTMINKENNWFYPNPNVLLEIGYAARAIGWNRVICLLNKASCEPEQLPFDIRHRRVSSYCCKDISEKKKAAVELESILYYALRTTIQEIGRGEFDPFLGDTALKHQRDLRLLRQLMSTIHRGTLDNYIERGRSNHIHYDCIFFWHSFDAVVTSSSFRFYDKVLETLAIELHRVWQETHDYGASVFFPGFTPGSFVLLPEQKWSSEYASDVQAMGEAYDALPDALNKFLNHVHEHFQEIDMDETDKAAWEENWPYISGEHFKREIEDDSKGKE